jgi:sulfate permease, SulP family
MAELRRYLPILTWLRGYERSMLLSDLMAGLTVAAFTIPESVAYADLAGLPPQAGLYASLVAPLLYFILGTSRQLVIGPTSALSIMVASGLAVFVVSSPEQYAALAALTALLVGAISLVAWLLRLGVVVNFISEPVLVGFSAGAALTIASTQLGKLFGIHGGEGEFFERIAYLLAHLGETHLPSLLFGLAGLAVLWVGHRFFHRWPVALIVVVVSIAIMAAPNLAPEGVATAGDIPTGLPALDVPPIGLDLIIQLLPLALGVFLLAYVEGMSVAKAYASKYGAKVDANQELLALGGASMAAGLFQAFPVGGSLSRSAVNDSSGAKTPLAGGIAALIIGVVLLTIAGVFSLIPEPILAAVVLVAVQGLFDVAALRRLHTVRRVEFWLAIAVLFAVLVFGLLEGVLIGVIVSVLVLMGQSAFPHILVLVREPRSGAYGDREHHPDWQGDPDVLVIGVAAPVFYANAEVVQEGIAEEIAACAQPPRLVVLEFASTQSLDTTTADALGCLAQDLAAVGGPALRLANVSDQPRTLLAQMGHADLLGGADHRQPIGEVIAEWRAGAGG